MVYSNTI